MIKCNNKFCTKTNINTLKQAAICRSSIHKKNLNWNGVCFYHSYGRGCPECGGRISIYHDNRHCLDCGINFTVKA